MTGRKPWYQSTTIQGLIIIVASIVTGKAGMQFGEGEKALLVSIIQGGGEVVGSIMVLWGRLKAKEELTLKAPRAVPVKSKKAA